jgi:hypothetical protein
MTNFKRTFASLVFFSILLIGFNNCGQQFVSTKDSSSLSSPSENLEGDSSSGLNGTISSDKTICEQDLILHFANGYHNFAKTNCTLCHVSGPGKGRFADSNVEDAFNDFMQTGYSKFSNNATGAHNPPASGPQHVQEINELRLGWQRAILDYDKCSGSDLTNQNVDLSEKISLETNQIIIPDMAIGENKTISWTLNTDLKLLNGRSDLPNLPGAQLSIQVAKNMTSGGASYYTVYSPKLFNSSVDAKVQSIFVKLNGRLQNYPTTFKFLDNSIRAGTKNSNDALLSTGSIVIPGVFSTEDKISLAFIDISKTTLPPPMPPLQVNFKSNTDLKVDSNTGVVSIDLELSAPSDYELPVSVSVDYSSIFINNSQEVDIRTSRPQIANLLCPETGCADSVYKLRRANNIIGTTYNIFNWDYKVISNSVRFKPGETVKSIQLSISKDIRFESNKLIVLSIDNPGNNLTVGSKNRTFIAIEKAKNPQPAIGEVTFTALMKSGGILSYNCVKCHNSKDRNGGYDMTDYELMKSKGVIIPGDIESKMFYRMNPASPNYLGTSPMPLDGALDIVSRKAVEQWILSGAKNN